MGEVFIKGHALREHVLILRELYGDAATERVIGGLSPELGRLVKSGGLLTSGWYPVAWSGEIYRVAMQLIPGAAELPEQVAHRSVERDMKGIYGFLARLVSPEFCIRQAPRILGTYFKGPSISVEVIEPGHAEMSFADCHGFTRAVWRDIVAGAEYIFRHAGAKDVKMRFTSGGRDSDARARVDVRWD